MYNQKDSKQSVKIEDERTDNHGLLLQSNDNAIVFVPVENIRAIEQVIDNWEDVKQRWNQVQDENRDRNNCLYKRRKLFR